MHLSNKELGASTQVKLCIASHNGLQIITIIAYSQEERQSEDIESKMDPVDKLTKLADLKQKGILTNEEFQRLKIKLLEKI